LSALTTFGSPGSHTLTPDVIANLTADKANLAADKVKLAARKATMATLLSGV
jgi:hypothetical protein